MKTIAQFFAALLLATTAVAQPAKHVILISIDGFRPDFYKEDKWGTPNLHQLVAAGSYADGVRGVFPTVTYPSHTAIISGALPITHGVYYNTPFEPKGQTGRWYWEYDSIKVPTLWTAIHDAHMTSGAVSWPVTYKAPIDYNIPEYWSLDKKVTRMSVLEETASPKGLFEEIQQNATGQLTVEDFNGDYMTLDENNARMTAYIITKYKPALVAVHLPLTDHAEHTQGRDGDMVRRAIAGADHGVGRIIDAVKQAGIADSTVIIVTGDHGFVDIHTSLSPNVWLARKGLLDANDNAVWKAKFHASGGSAFLFLKDKNDKKTLAAVRDILEHLPASYQKLFSVVDRAALDKIGADSNVPLALAATQGVVFGANTSGEDNKATYGGTHGYFPDFKNIQTGFIVAGAGIAHGTVIPEMGLEDIAPLIAQLLGLPFIAPDGVLYPRLLEKMKKNN